MTEPATYSATTASKPRVLLAFGGNASYPPNIKGFAEEQFALIEQACEHIARMVGAGYKLIITHGNGPVVGNILFRMARTSKELAPMPMDVCVAHSQGGMGYMMQQTLANVLHRHHLEATVSSIITQVEVDAHDPGFAHATKPVGRFLTQEDADRLAQETGWEFAEDAGRGFRRVVPSPKPKAIIDVPSIEALLLRNIIPIAAGGGGIPVVRDANGELHGVPAVIDKDLTSAMLASAVGARHLIMLTGVDRVALDFGKPTQRALDTISVKDAQRHMADGQFPAGSMGPKISAALDFLSRSEGRVVITSIQQAFDALQGNAGTRIVR